jgi:hypothetical protein
MTKVQPTVKCARCKHNAKSHKYELVMGDGENLYMVGQCEAKIITHHNMNSPGSRPEYDYSSEEFCPCMDFMIGNE